MLAPDQAADAKASMNRLAKREGDVGLSSQIANILRDRIIRDEIQPGSSIRERQLSKELNVSRTPLREALKSLSQEGLVEHRQNRGVVVVDYSLDDVSDMLQVYFELDFFGGKLACRIATMPDYLRIQGHIDSMSVATEANDRVSYFEANEAFHREIIVSSRSKTTIEFHSKLALRLYRTRYLAMLKNDRWRERHDEHTAILNALRDRDVEKFTAIHKQHFAAVWEMLEYWSERQSA